jgi:hypothetical protein
MGFEGNLTRWTSTQKSTSREFFLRSCGLYVLNTAAARLAWGMPEVHLAGD